MLRGTQLLEYCDQIFKESFGWVKAVSTIVSMIGVVLVSQPAFIFGSPHDSGASADTKGGGSGTPAQTSIAIGLAFSAAVCAAFAFLAIRGVKVMTAMFATMCIVCLCLCLCRCPWLRLCVSASAVCGCWCLPL